MGYLSNRRSYRYDGCKHTDIAVLSDLRYAEGDDEYANRHGYDDCIPVALHCRLENEEAIDGDDYEYDLRKVCDFKEGVFTESAIGSLILACMWHGRELTDTEVVEIVMPYIAYDVRHLLSRMLQDAQNKYDARIRELGEILMA